MLKIAPKHSEGIESALAKSKRGARWLKNLLRSRYGPLGILSAGGPGQIWAFPCKASQNMTESTPSELVESALPEPVNLLNARFKKAAAAIATALEPLKSSAQEVLLEEYLEEVVSFFVDAKKFAAFVESCVIPVLGAVADDEALTSPN